MLLRRGFRVGPGRYDLPFPSDLDARRTERLARLLDHYAFRLFLRGAIQRAAGFDPEEATRYLTAEQAGVYAAQLSELGLAEPCGDGRLRLVHPSHSFGGTLEWYVGRELHRRLGMAVATGVKFRCKDVGGDLDVVAAAEGRLVYLELSSSPPRHLLPEEVVAFFDRLGALRPDLALFVVDTALRLSDKVLPMLQGEIERRGGAVPVPRRIVRECWEIGPRLFALGAKGDLMRNVARCLAEGWRQVAPSFP
jgi:hypothetical protein